MTVHRRLAVLVMMLAALAAACGGNACGSGSTGGGSGDGSGGGSALRGSITVLAAASLTESFDELGRRFRAANPGVDVTFGYDASSSLVQQVRGGAPADVLATADEVTMQQAVDAGAVSGPAVFARNRLAIVVEAGNPKGVRGLSDLARPGLVVVLCADQVPCGRFSAQVLDGAGVRVQPRSLEANVKGVVSKVALGEADAGIAYVTDAKAAGTRVEAVAIPDAQNVVAAYPIATVRASRNQAVAQAFVDYVRSPAGRSVLETFGFAAA